jgi:hypothetical protein
MPPGGLAVISGSPGADRAGTSVRAVLAARGRLCHHEGGIERVGLAGLLRPFPLLLLP